MSEEQSTQDRTEQATEKRKEDFRKKGQVAQSKEIHTAAILTASCILWYFYAPWLWEGLQDFTRHNFMAAHAWEPSRASIIETMLYSIREYAKFIAPPLLIILVIGFVSTISQIGFLFTTDPLKPNLNKLDPIKGAKKFVSPRALVEMAKAIIKVSVVTFVAFITVKSEFDRAILLTDSSAAEALKTLMSISFWVLLKSSLVVALLSIFDYSFTKYELARKMRMTKEEVKKEFKESEGDPHLKAKIKQVQQEMSGQRMMEETAKADVVITNPTHYAIAIKYEPDKYAVPRVTAKGTDHLAFKLRKVAKDNKVNIVENKPVARALYKVKVGKPIPAEYFQAVAEILNFVAELEAKQGRPTPEWRKALERKDK